MTPTIEDAIILATQAHAGQVDKAGLPYILHPLRVMLRVESETEQTVAILHDVVEDTSITLDDLREDGYSEEILEAVDYLTRRESETYRQFIERVKENELARIVKLADLEDNMDPSRNPNPTEEISGLRVRYQRAYEVLQS